MNNLNQSFVSPHLIDLILVFTCLEALFLIVRRRAGRRSLRYLEIGLTLLPGVCLLLALRAALAGAAWPWVPAALGAALISHLLDLRERLRR